jgi:Flp pilus assembly protein TadG
VRHIKIVQRIIRSESGAAMVELALALPILLLIVWGVIDFGRLLYTTNSLASAVREGARFAAVLATPGTQTTAIRTAVKRTFVPIGSSALTNAQIVVADDTAVNGTITVRIVDYPWATITPLSAVLGSSRNLTRQATFRWERATP